MLCFIKQKPEVVPQATTALRKSLSIERLVIKSWALWAPGGAEQPLLVSLPNTIIAFHLPSLPLALATVWPHTKLFSHSFYYKTPLSQCREKNRNSSKPQQHLITNQEENELRENVNSFKVFKMVLELLKCKLRKLWTETWSTETGSL